MGGKARELKHRISVWSVVRGQLCKGHGDSAGSWQRAAGRIEEGVRSQNSGGKKHKKCPFLLATDYLGFCDLNYLNNGQRIRLRRNNGRRAMRFAITDFAGVA